MSSGDLETVQHSSGITIPTFLPTCSTTPDPAPDPSQSPDTPEANNDCFTDIFSGELLTPQYWLNDVNPASARGVKMTICEVSNVVGAITPALTASGALSVQGGTDASGPVSFDYALCNSEGLRDSAPVVMYVTPIEPLRVEKLGLHHFAVFNDNPAIMRVEFKPGTILSAYKSNPGDSWR